MGNTRNMRISWIAGALVALVFFVPQAHAICSLCGTVCPETCFEQLSQMVNDDQMVYNADGNINLEGSMQYAIQNSINVSECSQFLRYFDGVCVAENCGIVAALPSIS